MSSLRLARVTTLEDLENHPPSRQANQQPIRSRELEAVPAAPIHKVHRHVGQIKYNIGGDSPLLERIAFWTYLSIFRWFKRHFNFIALTHEKVLPDGSVVYGWLEHQGCFNDEASAKADAARYPFGFVVEVPIGSSLTADTVDGDYQFPNKEGPLASLLDLTPLLKESHKLKEAVRAARANQ